MQISTISQEVFEANRTRDTGEYEKTLKACSEGSFVQITTASPEEYKRTIAGLRIRRNKLKLSVGICGQKKTLQIFVGNKT